MRTISHWVKWMLLGALAFAGAAHATDGVVGPGNCDEPGFAGVLSVVDGSGGGTITFDCGSAPVTITFTSYKTIAGAVTIDGGDRITFDGGNASALFQIFASANATLRRMTLQHAVFSASHALENFGALTLDRVQVTANSSTESPVVNYGTLVVRSSTFSGNVLSGATGNGGALSNLSGTLDVAYSTFSANNAFDGGAIYVDQSSGAVHIGNSIFSANTAGYGAAIETWGSDVQILSSRFDGNHAQSGDAGAVWSLQGQVGIDGSQFTSNTAATTGGAISCYGGFMTVTRSAFGSNQSASHGGAVYSTCAFMAVNATFSGNTANGAGSGGGAVYQNDPAHDSLVVFVTVSGNSAGFGGGLYNEGASSHTLYIGNSIISANSGGNCDGVLASNGYNLSNDTGCGSAFNGPGDVLNASLPLQPFGNYGGSTSTMPPQPGNPAIDHVPIANCGFPTDQRDAARPAGVACDSGAFEVGGVIDLIFADGFDWL